MGYQNVGMVYTFFSKSGLSHRELLALGYLALVADDRSNPPVYFGGWPAIADALGYNGNALHHLKTPQTATAEELREAKAESEKVRRVMQALRNHGAIVSSDDARTSIHADYALALVPGISWKPGVRYTDERGRLRMSWQKIELDSPTKKVGHENTSQVGQSPPKRWGSDHLKGGDSPTPKVGPNTKKTNYEEYGEKKSSLGDPLTWEPPPEIFNDDSQDSLETEYDTARGILSNLPDLGQSLLSAVDADQPGLASKERFIQASKLAPKQRKGKAA